MKQEKFIYLANTLNIVSVTQDEHGNTAALFKDGIVINHNYHGNKVTLAIGKNRKYAVPNDTEIETLFKFFLEKTDLFQFLYEYAESRYDKVL